MKNLKKSLLAICLGISILGLSNLISEDSFFSSLRQLSLINSAQAEMLPEVVVSPNKGHADVRTCKYWTVTIDGHLTIALEPNFSIGAGWTQHFGTKQLCDNKTKDYCDYIGCH
jgi:hypothetical protein